MRAVLTIFGIAILALIISMLRQPSKDLTDDPATRDEARRNAAATAPAKKQPTAPQVVASVPPEEGFKPPREGVITAVMSVQGRGDVTMEFYPRAAPKTVEKFTRLIKAGYYDGMKFHRVVPDFVVQIGELDKRSQPFSDPKMAESTIKYEDNSLTHVTGSLGVALTSPHSDTGNSQFFINLKPNHEGLDGKYCVFGRVTQGMDVVAKIQVGDVVTKFALK